MNLYVIDGNSYIYRAFYAIKHLTTSKGLPTNAVYGFTNMLIKIIREKSPDGLLISFDSSVPTERHVIYEKYKAHRPQAPLELIGQIPLIRKIIAAFRIPVLEFPGYEADDVIGTIAVRASRKGATVYIVTADKDMLQLVDGKVKIYDPMKERILDAEYVHGRYGVGPERVTELMALMGDTVDNIPGIKGVGEKTATELLLQFSSIEELLSHPERIRKERLRRLVSENADDVRLSRRLATLHTDLPLEVDFEVLSLKEPEWPALLSLFREFEFGSLMKLIPSAPVAQAETETVWSLTRVREIAAMLTGGFAFAVEGTDGDPLKSNLAGLAISTQKEDACYIPVSHSYAGEPSQPAIADVLAALSPVFEDKGIAKTGHNMKYGMMVLTRAGCGLKGMLYDTMIASYLLNPNKSNHSPEEIALEYLSFRKTSRRELLGRRKTFSEVPIDDASAFAGEEALISLSVKDVLFDRLEKDGLANLYFSIEMPLISVLADMEMTGVKIDCETLNRISFEMGNEMEGIAKRIYFLAGEEFNINSPKQLSEVLFHSLGFQPGKKTKTGFSTGAGVLEVLAQEHELPREILNYRGLMKLKTTYIDVLPALINPSTLRVHTSFNQTVTSTGRLSSSDPNLQNIPIKGEWANRIRRTFVAEDGNLLVSADYSQIELRILAHLSGDGGLISAFKDGVDVHSRTASELFNVPVDKVTAEARRIAKTVNFGIVYGISPFGLSETLGITREAAGKFIRQYFERHPGVKEYIDKSIREAKGAGFVSTVFGRRRAVPELASRNAVIRQQGERFAVNSPIQGTAADIIKIAMIKIWNTFREKGMKGKLILQVHDELLFELPEQELDATLEEILLAMEGAVDLAVPLKVETGHGKNWAEAAH